jgi:hypothetical protein
MPNPIYTGPTQEVRQLEQALSLNEEEKALLARYGCILEDHAEGSLIRFPPGTTRTQIAPHTMCIHYRINLPNGQTLYEDVDWHRKDGIRLWCPGEE